MAEFAYPLDGTQNYTASQAGAFNGTRTSGVWSGEDNLKVSITDARQLTVSAGVAWFTTDTYWGKVYVNTAPVNLTLPTADGVLDRICRVVVRWNKTNNVAKIEMLNGTLASAPVPPARSTTDELFDLVLADYLVQHGETAAADARLTDQRLNEDLCGLMRDGVTRIPTATLYNQFTDLLEELEYDLEQVIAGNIPAHASTHTADGVDPISHFYTAQIGTTWVGSAAPYTQEIAVAGLLATDKPIVDMIPSETFATAEAQIEGYGNIYRMVAGAGALTVYAVEPTTTAIDIQMEVVR